MPEFVPDDATLMELGKLHLQIGNNPKTRRKYFQLVKEIDPARYERFADQRIEDRLEEEKQAREKAEFEREQEKHRTRLEAARAKLLDRYSADDVAKIEELMTRLGIADYDAGARVYAADLAAAAPRNLPPKPHTTWELPNFEAMSKNPVAEARNAAYAVIDELRRGNR